MFAVIFFVSVGMKVDPSVIAEHWTSIIPIAIIAVIAKLIFATLGMILSGQRMETSLKSGFSLVSDMASYPEHHRGAGEFPWGRWMNTVYPLL